MKTNLKIGLPMVESFSERQKYINLEIKMIELIDEINQTEIPEENEENIVESLEKLIERMFLMRTQFDNEIIKNNYKL
jgi:hypothetical protein